MTKVLIHFFIAYEWSILNLLKERELYFLKMKKYGYKQLTVCGRRSKGE